LEIPPEANFRRLHHSAASTLPAKANSHPMAVGAESLRQRAAHSVGPQFPHRAQDSWRLPIARPPTAGPAPPFLIVLRRFFCPLNEEFCHGFQLRG
jgi:hypothetical protein